MNVAVIIPCFNEAERLNKQSFIEFSKRHPHIHFHFINDGSQDHTEELLKSFCQTDGLQYVSLEHNSGKAEAVRQGLLRAHQLGNYDWLGFWDADLATPLDEIVYFLDTLRNHPQFHVLIGSRHLRLGTNIERTFLRHFFGRVFATVASLMLKLKVYDTQCGAKLFSRECLPALFGEPFVSPWFFDVEILFRAQGLPSPCLEIPLHEWHDMEGSKLKLIDFLKVPLELLKIYRHYGHQRSSQQQSQRRDQTLVDSDSIPLHRSNDSKAARPRLDN